MAPPRLKLSFLWLGIFVLESTRLPHLGMAALVGSTQLCGMVDAPLELVFAKRAVRHTATASATILTTRASQLASRLRLVACDLFWV